MSSYYDINEDVEYNENFDPLNISKALNLTYAVNASSQEWAHNFTDVVNASNQNATYSGEVPHQFPKDMLGFTAACAFIIAIFGASGNLLTIFALPMCRKLRTTATAFVVNLAVVELLFCIFILPMSGAQYAYLQFHDSSLLSNTDCVYFAVARYTFTQVQLQTIVGIALTRAIAVSLPKFYQKINNPVVIGVYIAMVWIYSFSLKLPTGLGIFGSYIFNPKTMECDVSMDPVSRFARFISLIVEALVPVCFVLLLYIFIFIMVLRRSVQRSRKFRKPSTISAAAAKKVKRSSMRVKSSRRPSKPSLSSTNSTALTSVSDDPTSGDEHEEKKDNNRFKSLKRMVSESSLKVRFTRRSSSITHCINTNRRDMRVARTIFIIFVMIVGFSVPVSVIHTIDSEGKQPKRFLAVHILYWLQYCLNVVVYVLMNRQYRDAYIECLARLIPGWERHKGFTFPWETPSSASKPFNSSCKGRKDSSAQQDLKVIKEFKDSKLLDRTPSRQGRLSAIPEINSSSVVSNDDVFTDDKKIENLYPNINDLNDNPVETAQKEHTESGTSEEKQLWLTKNGMQTCNDPCAGDKV